MIFQLIANGIIAGCTYALIALGFTIIYGAVRFFHFAHGAVFAASAYGAWAATVFLQASLPVAALVGAGTGGVIGVLIETIVYRRLRARRAPGLILLLASFGVFLLLQSFLQLAFGSDIKLLRQSVVRSGHEILGAFVTDAQILIVGASVVLAAVVVLFLRRARFGKAIRAVADDPLASRLVGINADRTIGAAFFLGSALAGVAGVLVALESNIQPYMGLNASIKGIISALIGGMGSIPGAMLGGLLIGLAENLGVWGISTGWKDAVAFAVLVVFLLLRPNGLFGSNAGIRKV